MPETDQSEIIGKGWEEYVDVFDDFMYWSGQPLNRRSRRQANANETTVSCSSELSGVVDAVMGSEGVSGSQSSDLCAKASESFADCVENTQALDPPKKLRKRYKGVSISADSGSEGGSVFSSMTSSDSTLQQSVEPVRAATTELQLVSSRFSAGERCKRRTGGRYSRCWYRLFARKYKLGLRTAAGRRKNIEVERMKGKVSCRPCSVVLVDVSKCFQLLDSHCCLSPMPFSSPSTKAVNDPSASFPTIQALNCAPLTFSEVGLRLTGLETGCTVVPAKYTTRPDRDFDSQSVAAGCLHFVGSTARDGIKRSSSDHVTVVNGETSMVPSDGETNSFSGSKLIAAQNTEATSILPAAATLFRGSDAPDTAGKIDVVLDALEEQNDSISYGCEESERSDDDMNGSKRTNCPASDNVDAQIERSTLNALSSLSTVETEHRVKQVYQVDLIVDKRTQNKDVKLTEKTAIYEGERQQREICIERACNEIRYCESNDVSSSSCDDRTVARVSASAAINVSEIHGKKRLSADGLASNEQSYRQQCVTFDGCKSGEKVDLLNQRGATQPNVIVDSPEMIEVQGRTGVEKIDEKCNASVEPNETVIKGTGRTYERHRNIFELDVLSGRLTESPCNLQLGVAAKPMDADSVKLQPSDCILRQSGNECIWEFQSSDAPDLNELSSGGCSDYKMCVSSRHNKVTLETDCGDRQLPDEIPLAQKTSCPEVNEVPVTEKKYVLNVIQENALADQLTSKMGGDSSCIDSAATTSSGDRTPVCCCHLSVDSVTEYNEDVANEVVGHTSTADLEHAINEVDDNKSEKSMLANSDTSIVVTERFMNQTCALDQSCSTCAGGPDPTDTRTTVSPQRVASLSDSAVTGTCNGPRHDEHDRSVFDAKLAELTNKFDHDEPQIAAIPVDVESSLTKHREVLGTNREIHADSLTRSEGISNTYADDECKPSAKCEAVFSGPVTEDNRRVEPKEVELERTNAYELDAQTPLCFSASINNEDAVIRKGMERTNSVGGNDIYIVPNSGELLDDETVEDDDKHAADDQLPDNQAHSKPITNIKSSGGEQQRGLNVSGKRPTLEPVTVMGLASDQLATVEEPHIQNEFELNAETRSQGCELKETVEQLEQVEKVSVSVKPQQLASTDLRDECSVRVSLQGNQRFDRLASARQLGEIVKSIDAEGTIDASERPATDECKYASEQADVVGSPNVNEEDLTAWIATESKYEDQLISSNVHSAAVTPVDRHDRERVCQEHLVGSGTDKEVSSNDIELHDESAAVPSIEQTCKKHGFSENSNFESPEVWCDQNDVCLDKEDFYAVVCDSGAGLTPKSECYGRHASADMRKESPCKRAVGTDEFSKQVVTVACHSIESLSDSKAEKCGIMENRFSTSEVCAQEVSGLFERQEVSCCETGDSKPAWRKVANEEAALPQFVSDSGSASNGYDERSVESDRKSILIHLAPSKSMIQNSSQLETASASEEAISILRESQTVDEVDVGGCSATGVAENVCCKTSDHTDVEESYQNDGAVIEVSEKEPVICSRVANVAVEQGNNSNLSSDECRQGHVDRVIRKSDVATNDINANSLAHSETFHEAVIGDDYRLTQRKILLKDLCLNVNSNSEETVVCGDTQDGDVVKVGSKTTAVHKSVIKQPGSEFGLNVFFGAAVLQRDTGSDGQLQGNRPRRDIEGSQLEEAGQDRVHNLLSDAERPSAGERSVTRQEGSKKIVAYSCHICKMSFTVEAMARSHMIQEHGIMTHGSDRYLHDAGAAAEQQYAAAAVACKDVNSGTASLKSSSSAWQKSAIEKFVDSQTAVASEKSGRLGQRSSVANYASSIFLSPAGDTRLTETIGSRTSGPMPANSGMSEITKSGDDDVIFCRIEKPVRRPAAGAQRPLHRSKPREALANSVQQRSEEFSHAGRPQHQLIGNSMQSRGGRDDRSHQEVVRYSGVPASNDQMYVRHQKKTDRTRSSQNVSRDNFHLVANRYVAPGQQQDLRGAGAQQRSDRSPAASGLQNQIHCTNLLPPSTGMSRDSFGSSLRQKADHITGAPRDILGSSGQYDVSSRLAGTCSKTSVIHHPIRSATLAAGLQSSSCAGASASSGASAYANANQPVRVTNSASSNICRINPMRPPPETDHELQSMKLGQTMSVYPSERGVVGAATAVVQHPSTSAVERLNMSRLIGTSATAARGYKQITAAAVTPFVSEPIVSRTSRVQPALKHPTMDSQSAPVQPVDLRSSLASDSSVLDLSYRPMPPAAHCHTGNKLFDRMQLLPGDAVADLSGVHASPLAVSDRRRHSLHVAPPPAHIKQNVKPSRAEMGRCVALPMDRQPKEQSTGNIPVSSVHHGSANRFAVRTEVQRSWESQQQVRGRETPPCALPSPAHRGASAVFTDPLRGSEVTLPRPAHSSRR